MGNRGQNGDRVLVSSDDEFIIHRMERKRKMMMAQEEGVDNIIKNMALDKEEYGGQEQLPNHNRDEGEMGFTKGLMGNPRTILKEVGNLK